jgi:hypothetical protein
MGRFFDQSTKKRDLPFRAARAGLARKIVVQHRLTLIAATIEKDIDASKLCQASHYEANDTE